MTMTRPAVNDKYRKSSRRMNPWSIVAYVLCYVVGYQHGKRLPWSIDDPIHASESFGRSSAPARRVSVDEVVPLEHTEHKAFLPGWITDAYNPFTHYLHVFSEDHDDSNRVVFPELPLWHTWFPYLEAYHNHMHRFRGKMQVIFMEVGVQSGGKIPLLRNYFGPGFVYIGIYVNPSTKSKFQSADWIHIEIGDSGDERFWEKIKGKYPHVDIFLDDGGHTMQQQKLALKEMLPHLRPDGVYICEDLSTSWSTEFGGIPNADSRSPEFLNKTMVGLVHQSIDWLNYGWIPGGTIVYQTIADDWFNEELWRTVAQHVKHIHYYNQLVVYEKGIVHHPHDFKTVGDSIPYSDSGTYNGTNWGAILNKIQMFMAGSK